MEGERGEGEIAGVGGEGQKLLVTTGCPICSWTWVGLTLQFGCSTLLPSCLATSAKFPVARRNRAYSGTLKIQINPTKSTSRWDTLYTRSSTKLVRIREEGLFTYSVHQILTVRRPLSVGRRGRRRRRVHHAGLVRVEARVRRRRSNHRRGRRRRCRRRY